jgi:hypothetical protein
MFAPHQNTGAISMKKRTTKAATPRSADARLIAYARRLCALDASASREDALWTLHGELRQAMRRAGLIV